MKKEEPEERRGEEGGTQAEKINLVKQGGTVKMKAEPNKQPRNSPETMITTATK